MSTELTRGVLPFSIELGRVLVSGVDSLEVFATLKEILDFSGMRLVQEDQSWIRIVCGPLAIDHALVPEHSRDDVLLLNHEIESHRALGRHFQGRIHAYGRWTREVYDHPGTYFDSGERRLFHRFAGGELETYDLREMAGLVPSIAAAVAASRYLGVQVSDVEKSLNQLAKSQNRSRFRLF